MKLSYLTAAFFCFSVNQFSLAEESNTTNIIINNQNEELSITDQRYQMAIQMKEQIKQRKVMPIFMPNQLEFGRYNYKMRELVELSQDAFSSDLSVIDGIYQDIATWNNERTKLNKVKTYNTSGRYSNFFGQYEGQVYHGRHRTFDLESKMTMMLLSIQHHLLERQNKTDEIVDLIFSVYPEAEDLPIFYRHHLAKAYLQLQDPEKAINVLELFDFTKPKVKLGTIRLLLKAYVINKQFEQALALINMRQAMDDNVVLEQLKYAVLVESGDQDAADEVAKVLKLQGLHPETFSRGRVSIVWSPILDHI